MENTVNDLLTSHDSKILELKNELAELKNELAEIRQYKGIVGPRGPAGPIDAAVQNAAVAATAASIKAVREELVYPFESRVEKTEGKFAGLEKEMAEYRASLEDSVALYVVKILQEYQVLNEKMEPMSLPYLKHALHQLGVLN